MKELLLRLRADLRTTLVGADPAPPAKPLRPFLSALGVLVIVSLGASATVYLDEQTALALPVAAVMGTLTVLSLLFVRYKPLWAWRFVAVSLLIGFLDPARPAEGWPWNPMQIIASLVVLFAVGLREPVGVILWSGLISLAIVWGIVPGEEVAGITILLATIMVFGEQIQRRRSAQRQARELSEHSGMLTERARIARELHDVVAHSLSLVAVRAETAPYRLAEVSGAAREEFVALAATARESLTELRRLLGVLRTEADPERSPQPTLSDVDELVEAMRAAGMSVSYEGTDVVPPAAAGLTVYRIVQEGLSNAALARRPASPPASHRAGSVAAAVFGASLQRSCGGWAGGEAEGVAGGVEHYESLAGVRLVSGRGGAVKMEHALRLMQVVDREIQMDLHRDLR